MTHELKATWIVDTAYDLDSAFGRYEVDQIIKNIFHDFFNDPMNEWIVWMGEMFKWKLIAYTRLVKWGVYIIKYLKMYWTIFRLGFKYG